jgi:hypothetical protein
MRAAAGASARSPKLETRRQHRLESSFTDDLKTPWLRNIARFLGRIGSLDDLRKAASQSEIRMVQE